MGTHHFAVLAMACVATPTVSAQAPAPLYLLSIHFDDGEQLRGDPRLQVRAGEPATIRIGNEGRNIITLRMTATPTGAGTLKVVSAIDATTVAGVHRRAAPTMLVRPNETAAIAFGEQSATARPVRVSFSYAPMAATTPVAARGTPTMDVRARAA